MLPYLLRRFCYSLMVLWGVATLAFLLFQVLPAGPARKALHQDKPLWARYALYLNDLSPIGLTSTKKAVGTPAGLHLTRVTDSRYLSLKVPFLGLSNHAKRPISAILWERLPATILLVLTAMLAAALPGLVLGLLAAQKRNTFWDTGAMAASVAGVSMPSYFVALIVAYAFMHQIGGRHPALHNPILPAIVLGIRPMAIIIQLTRSAMLDVLSRDYIRTAYAKGLGKGRVVLRHALPNALIPVIAAASDWLAELLAGTLFVEYILGWDGIGKITVDALDMFDIPLVMGAVLLMALGFIIIKLMTDVLHGLLDPRARS